VPCYGYRFPQSGVADKAPFIFSLGRSKFLHMISSSYLSQFSLKQQAGRAGDSKVSDFGTRCGSGVGAQDVVFFQTTVLHSDCLAPRVQAKALR
jgi:hypothetical protein